MGVSTGAEILSLINQTHMEVPQVDRNMAITPLINPAAERYGDVLSLDLAMELGQMDVSETGNVPNLRFSTDRPTLIRSGEAVLAGGNQDRIVRSSAVIEGNTMVDVFCIEAGRWAPQNPGWVRTDTPVSLRNAVLRGAGQDQVWSTVAKILNNWGVNSQTNALGAIYQKLGNQFERRASKFKLLDNQVGMIITIDDKVRGLELFGDRMAFSRDAMSILKNAYVPEILSQREGHMDRQDIESSVEVFRSEITQGSRAMESLHHDGRFIYACAV
ncbi:MAG: DUF6569 family protein [Candidatus Thorarchaeota archaeon]